MDSPTVASPGPRCCLKEPVAEIFHAARYLDAAVSAHAAGKPQLAEELIRMADDPRIAEWTESLWGKGGPWTRPLPVESPAPYILKAQRPGPRMPNAAMQMKLLERDGHHCRFCGIPAIRAEVRRRITAAYPLAARWKPGNPNQHAGFQAMWVQYDHILPNSRGGETSFENLVITCAPCNFGRTELTLDEVGVTDPRSRRPVRSTWDGLERFEP